MLQDLLFKGFLLKKLNVSQSAGVIKKLGGVLYKRMALSMQ
jgi:hypothetical protein